MAKYPITEGIRALFSGEGEPKAEEPKVDNKLREDWNAYVTWLEKKGVKGKPELDKNDLGGKMIDEYRKEVPTTLVSRETIVPIQKEFSKYRDFVLNDVRNKKSQLMPGVTEDTFMKDLSVVDGIAGQRTTSFKFPQVYLNTFMNNKLAKAENKGFATTAPSNL